MMNENTPPSIENLVGQIQLFIDKDLGRIAWNSFLALIPLILSFYLFYRPRDRWLYWGAHVLAALGFGYGIRHYNYSTTGNTFWQSIRNTLSSNWAIDIVFTSAAIAIVFCITLLDLYLRRGSQRRSIYWYLLLPAFVIFLPNAPYILTDVIHFYQSVRIIDSVWPLTFVVLPVYILFIGLGWISYFFSLQSVKKYLQFQSLAKYILPMELSFHFLCAVGIYIGKFLRLNSWYFLTNRDILISKFTQELIGKFSLFVIFMTFAMLTFLYGITRYLYDRLTQTDRLSYDKQSY
jgi:uncharacterized membrane protein